MADKNKLGLSAIMAEAQSVAANPQAQEFVRAASTTPETALRRPQSAPEQSKTERMLFVEGHLKNRNERCQAPMQLYLRNELAAWMKRHAGAGRGGNQILINYLIRRGIEAVEQEYAESGIVFADESQD